MRQFFAGFRLTRAGKQRLIALLVVVLAGALSAGAGATFALASAPTESRLNPFTVGNVKVRLEELEWDENKPEDVVVWGGRWVKKDPQTVNTGKTPAYHFLEVWMPMAEVRVVSDIDPMVVGPKYPQELFEWEYAGTTGINPNWTQLFDLPVPSVDGNHMIYIFGYNNVVEPGHSSEPLFDRLRAINFLEGDIPAGTIIQMPIYTIAIQSDNLNESGGSLTDRLEDIYSIYKTIPEED